MNDLQNNSTQQTQSETDSRMAWIALVVIIAVVVGLLISLENSGSSSGGEYKHTCSFCDSHAEYSDGEFRYCSSHYRKYH